MTRTIAQQAELALLLEVATTPKPGNVDRHRDHDDLRFEHFLAGAVGASEGLEDLADPDGPPIGTAFERAVEGMNGQSGGNTQFGGLLLLAPLVRAAALGKVTPERATAVAEGTGVEDAAGFYRAFEHVDVAVADPPDDMDALDVRRGSDAVPDIRERNLSLFDILARSADHDGIAREWTNGFARTFDAAERLVNRDGPLLDRAAAVFLDLLAAEPDTFVAINHGAETAEDVRERAEAARDGDTDPETLAEELLAEGINPGTTADILAGGLFVALERGTEV
ncbi:triphosphoribosyl-dephospho-CoA synthase protein [Halorhabdus tiamatea SARL4B]|uniref:Triphosphoribosyl-dephospho-CoA synthase protein n=1 Tax=Halorhabdus tiamatea SARL4B TaxID=1033806 RepID=S6D1Y4_9EURY|nr:triphosphoribosyl-dephospho-CoA synthase [Halorhabdus tiamatea]ERJ07179.1 triphosphoribosyl-dephospho-CoA synthase protein [Halorhabdus tiamatea SARL4B]CCQ32800.1 triphosphoribosyl-dephospho-CoA synthetase [Halorhabdus tiamatea SARL4B]